MKEQAQAWWKLATQIAQQAVDQVEQFDELVKQLAVHDPNIAVPATWALQQAGPRAIPALLAGLMHTYPRVRRGCVDIIDHGGYGGDARCIAALVPLLHDPVPHIRRAVWHTLFCERCQDAAKCEIAPVEALDQVALLIAIGLNDPNLKLRGQLLDDLRRHQSDPRARLALESMKEKYDHQRNNH